LKVEAEGIEHFDIGDEVERFGWVMNQSNDSSPELTTASLV
jgi:hypothetical protein